MEFDLITLIPDLVLSWWSDPLFLEDMIRIRSIFTIGPERTHIICVHNAGMIGSDIKSIRITHSRTHTLSLSLSLCNPHFNDIQYTYKYSLHLNKWAVFYHLKYLSWSNSLPLSVIHNYIQYTKKDIFVFLELTKALDLLLKSHNNYAFNKSTG